MKLTYENLRKLIREETTGNTSVMEILLESPEMLAEKSIMKNKHPFKAIYIFGGAGAGKSFLSKQIGIPSDFVTSNPDERIESVFPAFGLSMKFEPFGRGEEKAASEDAKIQQSSREVLQNAEQSHTHNMLSIANPIVFDTTGEQVEKISGRMKSLMKVGYDIAVFMVNVPVDVSVSRDKDRDRTVGAPTKSIGDQYQKEVVQQRGYFKQLADLPYATVLGGDIYANLFDLSSGKLLDGITDEHVAAMKTSDGKPYTPEYAKQLLDQARSDLQAWLTPEPENPTGLTLLRGMRALVKASGGKHGQNLYQIGPAVINGYDEPDIVKAASLLADLGGAEDPIKKSQRGRKTAGKKFGKQKQSIRQMSGETEPTPMGGDLPPNSKGKVKQRKFEEQLTAKMEELLWKMLKEK